MDRSKLMFCFDFISFHNVITLDGDGLLARQSVRLLCVVLAGGSPIWRKGQFLLSSALTMTRNVVDKGRNRVRKVGKISRLSLPFD